MSRSGHFRAEDAKGASLLRESVALPSQKDAVIRVARLLTDMKMPAPQSIGHRIVHGGPKLKTTASSMIPSSMSSTRPCAFAPLHMPRRFVGHPLFAEHFPGIAAGRVFRYELSCRHAGIARVLPIPHALRAEGIERYGFHGLSCESIVRQLGGGVAEQPTHCAPWQWCEHHRREAREVD